LNSGRRLLFEHLEHRNLMAVSSVLLDSWQLAGQGQFAQVISGYNVAAGPSTTWPTNVPPGTTYNGGNSTPVIADVQKLSYSDNYAYINTANLSSYVMGPWFAANGNTFMNFPVNSNALYRIRESSYPSATRGSIGNGAVAVAVNGGSFFNNGDAFSYRTSTGTDVNGGDGIWNRQAYFSERVTFDHALAHQPGQGQSHYHVNPPALRAQLNDNIDYVGTTNYFLYDPQVLLTSGQGADGRYVERTTNLKHSPILGWSFDGKPIYGPYGYSTPTDPNSGIRRMETGFQLRSIANRTTYPGWAAQIAPISANVASDSTFTLAATQYGPPINAANPLGKYGEDYEFVPGRDLDQYNGRFAITPEYPQGVYAYYVTIGSTGDPVFPYLFGRQYEGPVNSGRVNNTAGDGAVTVVFDVSINTAPVLSGVNAASVQTGSTFAFSGANLVSIFDVDAATSESITFTVTTGTLSVDLSGALASGSTITAGANGSSSFTLTGGISQLNAALTTLTYAAPNTGSTATLTIQANDGSATNNLSNIVTTAMTLIAPASSIVNRQVFYHRSTSSIFGNGSGNPTTAIDTLKVPLLPGETTTAANYTNYSRGLNGLVIDVAGAPNLAGISAASFQFATWSSFPDSTPNFLAINPTVTVSTFAGGGLNGSDRVKLEFDNNAIQNAWLRVTMLADANTGLVTNDVFYFGNARFDVTPTSPFPSAQVTINAFDVNAIRARQGQDSGIISNIFDVDRSGVVNAFDTNAVRANQGVASLRSFTAPSSLQMGLANSTTNSTSLKVDSLFADTSWLEAFQSSNNRSRLRTKRF
jgi:YHYH protein